MDASGVNAAQTSALPARLTPFFSGFSLISGRRSPWIREIWRAAFPTSSAPDVDGKLDRHPMAVAGGRLGTRPWFRSTRRLLG